MKNAYQTMRGFWLDVKNLENRKEILEIGPDKISVAGMETAFLDADRLKKVCVVTNSLGNSSFYFENNSKSGLGGIIGENGDVNLQNAAAHFLAYAGKLTAQMTPLPAGSEFPTCSQEGIVCLFAVSKTHIFYVHLKEAEARDPANPFYPFYAYAQQTIGFFRQQQETKNSHF